MVVRKDSYEESRVIFLFNHPLTDAAWSDLKDGLRSILERKKLPVIELHLERVPMQIEFSEITVVSAGGASRVFAKPIERLIHEFAGDEEWDLLVDIEVVAP